MSAGESFSKKNPDAFPYSLPIIPESLEMDEGRLATREQYSNANDMKGVCVVN